MSDIVSYHELLEVPVEEFRKVVRRHYHAADLVRIEGFFDIFEGKCVAEPASEDEQVHPRLHIPGLRSRPWYDGDYHYRSRLEERSREIAGEYERLRVSNMLRPYGEVPEIVEGASGAGQFDTPGSGSEGQKPTVESPWQAFYFITNRERAGRNCRLCPITASVLLGHNKRHYLQYFSSFLNLA